MSSERREGNGKEGGKGGSAAPSHKYRNTHSHSFLYCRIHIDISEWEKEGSIEPTNGGIAQSEREIEKQQTRRGINI